MIKLKETKNEFGIDLIRVMAMYFVISLHFFLYNGYYAIEDVKPDIMFHVSFRALFFQCVPLFLMLTGYLKRNAKFEAKHYIKATPIIINSLIISGIVIAYKILWLKEHFSVLIWAKSVWSFTQPSYGWYVNMYLSLFLFIPLINAAYHSLKTQKQKFTSVIICICATTLSLTINRIRCPESMGGCIDMPLGYFNEMWPFAYYAVGMYIGEFRPKISRFITATGAAALCIAIAFANYATVTTNYYSGFIVDNGDILNVIISALLFLTLYDIKVNNKYIRWIFAKISALSMSSYLILYIFDSILYNRFASAFAGYSSYFPMYWKIVPLNFLLSILASIPVYIVGKFISKIIMKPLLNTFCKKVYSVETPEQASINEK